MLHMEVDIKHAEEIVKGIGIPVQAAIVNNFYKEIKKVVPDIRTIVSLTSRYVGFTK